MKIHEERARKHVIAAERLAIEVAAATGRNVEERIVDHQVPGHVRYAGQHDLPHEEPEPLGHEIRITIALEHQIALEPAVG